MTQELKNTPNDMPSEQSCSTQGGACPSCGGIKLLLLMLAGLVVAYFVTSRPALPPASPSAVKWVDYGDAITTAAQNNQPVLLAFKATWCGPCRMMENEVFAKDAAAKALTGWVPAHIDIDQQKKIANQYHVRGVPTLIALSPDGTEIARISGALSLSEFAGFLASAQAKLPAQTASAGRS